MRALNPIWSGRFQSEQHVSSMMRHSEAWRGRGREMSRNERRKNLSSPNTGLAASARAAKLREKARTSCGWACLSVGVSQRQSLEARKDQRMSHTNQWHQMSWDANDRPRNEQRIADWEQDMAQIG